MDKKKILIHGADVRGKKLARRIDHIFQIEGFIERDGRMQTSVEKMFPCYSDISEYPGDIDMIFSTVEDFNGLLREYVNKGIPFEKVFDFRHVHQYEKHILHQCLANEIQRKAILGAIAELGVDFGDTAKYLNLYYPERTLYLFDTFQGFDTRDRDVSQAKTEELLDFYNIRSNAEDVLSRMFYPECCVIKEGYFPESLDGLEDRFAFVHIDCDLYKPITAGLEYFYPRLNRGGYICVHDYYSLSFPKAMDAVRDFAQKQGLSFVTDFFSETAVFCKE
ncbi:MAG: TylF/MycF/NovP-related O-methyltransferase [Clostridium sp.]